MNIDAAVISEQVRKTIEADPEIAALLAKDMTAGDVHQTTALGNQAGSKKVSAFSAKLAEAKAKRVKAPNEPGVTVKADLVDRELPIQMLKYEPEQQKVMGWAYISARDGKLIVDKQDDMILPEDLEKAAHDFVLFSRSQGDMHASGASGDPEQHGRLIGSVVYTQEKLDKCGLAAFDPETGEQLFGWWVEFKVDSPDLWAAHKRGDRPEFSIGGRGKRVPV